MREPPAPDAFLPNYPSGNRMGVTTVTTEKPTKLLSYSFSIFSPQFDLKLSKISFMTCDLRLDPPLSNEVSVWNCSLRALSASLLCGCFGAYAKLTSHWGFSYRWYSAGSLASPHMSYILCWKLPAPKLLWATWDEKWLNNPCFWKKKLGAKNRRSCFR